MDVPNRYNGLLATCVIILGSREDDTDFYSREIVDDTSPGQQGDTIQLKNCKEKCTDDYHGKDAPSSGARREE